MRRHHSTTAILQSDFFLAQENLIAFYDARDNTTITQVGGKVTQWDDKSGNDYHFTQAVAARQPTLGEIAGQQAIRFDDRQRLLTPVWNLQSPLAFVCVYQFDVRKNQAMRLWDSGTPGVRYEKDSSGFSHQRRMYESVYLTGGVTEDLNPHVIFAVYDGTNSFFIIDEVTEAIGDAGGTTPSSGQLTLGSGVGGSRWFEGRIALLAVFEYSPVGTTTADIEKIDAYLKFRYSL
jgi:hypothetical protein